MNFNKEYSRYKKIYDGLKFAHKEVLDGLAESYDKWFLNEFVNLINQNCNFNKGKLQPTKPEVINALVAECTAKVGELIYPTISAYLVEYADDFYEEGIKLAQINAKMEGKVIDGKLSDNDKINIEILVDTELQVWKNHIEKHRRVIARELTGAIQSSQTVEQFLMRAVCPDEHVLAFTYGNGRVSWSEQIRRFLSGRPRMISMSACMRKLLLAKED